MLFISIIDTLSATKVCTNWIDRDNPSGNGDFETVPDQIPRSWISVIIQRCPESYQIQARHGRRMFTNPAQILLAYGLQTSFIYPTTGPALGTSGFACDWRHPTNRGKRRIDFSVRYCCVKPTPPTTTATSTTKPTSSLVTHCNNCSQWFDRDNPGGTGDWELAGLSLIPTSAIDCKSYMIQVKENSNSGNLVMTNSAQVLAITGNKATFRFPTSGFYGAGFVCTNRPSSANPALPSNQRQRCKDFSVRFCC